MENRRLIPRERVGWDGLCQIEGEDATPCRVVDLSMFGLGLTLNDPSFPQLEGQRNIYRGTTVGESVPRFVGRRISVDVPAVGDSVSIRLEGKVANAKRMSGAAVRVGIKFDRLAEPPWRSGVPREMSEYAGAEPRPKR
jgi:hypothetical protein